MRKRTSAKKQAKPSRQTTRPSQKSLAAAQVSEQLEYVVPGRIEAELIQATNVANQITIEKQEIHVARREGQEYRPPLQRPPRAEYFIGREAEQNWLGENLQPGRNVTLCGPGGMGKSALAAEVLWQIFPDKMPPEQFPDGLIVHNFSRQPQVAAALEQIARLFGEDPLPTPGQAAQRALNGRKILLVLDAAEEADDLKAALEVCAGQTILVLSRKRNDAPDPHALFNLHPLSTAQAVTVVQSWSQEQASETATIQQICQLVGNLPLALRLVGRYLALQQESAAEYLHWLQQTPLAALDHGKSPHESIVVLLDRSLDKVSEDARQALTVAGLLGQAPIGRDLITEVLALSETRVWQALGELHDYGLLQRSEQQYEVSHTLIHTYARQELLTVYDEADQCELATRIIHHLYRRLSVEREGNQVNIKGLVPHVQACLGLVDRYGLMMSEAAFIFNRIGLYFYRQALYTEAKLLLKRALDIRKRALGSEHPDTATSLNNLALLYYEQGNYGEAAPLYERALAICERVLGAEHPDTAMSLNNLAMLYHEQGNYVKAMPLCERALAIRERVLGAEHPDTAMSLNNLAVFYRSQENYGEAALLCKRALAICERVLGSEHPNTATSLNNLANLYQLKGNYGEAAPLYKRALAICERVLGSEHPDTATSLNNLANLYQLKGNYGEAAPLYERALAIYENVLGLEHPATKTVSKNYAACLREHD